MRMQKVVNIFKSENREEALKKIVKLYIWEEIFKKLKNEIEKIGKRFENITWYLEDWRASNTNNRIDLCYRISQLQRTKKYLKQKKSYKGHIEVSENKKDNRFYNSLP